MFRKVAIRHALERCKRRWSQADWIGGVSTERQILYHEGWRVRIQ